TQWQGIRGCRRCALQIDGAIPFLSGCGLAASSEVQEVDGRTLEPGNVVFFGPPMNELLGFHLSAEGRFERSALATQIGPCASQVAHAQGFDLLAPFVERHLATTITSSSQRSEFQSLIQLR